MATPSLTLDTPLSHVHRFVCGGEEGKTPLLMLHGTGGDENDLLPLGRMIGPGRSLVSPRGQVMEQGMPRFFRRFAEGVFDLDDVRERADALGAFVAEARSAYGIGRPIAVGFSNGANIAAALMLRHADALGGAILIRAMPTIDPAPDLDLAGLPVLMLSGQMDPIVPAQSREALARALSSRGAAVTTKVLPAGHGLTQSDVDEASVRLDAR